MLTLVETAGEKGTKAMAILVEYGDCPKCWQESETARTMGFDPDKGIICEAGHTFESNPDFHAPKKIHTLEEKTAPAAKKRAAAPVAVAEPEDDPSLAAASPSPGLAEEPPQPGENPPARSQNVFANRPEGNLAVSANQALRLPGRDLLFGLVIPETLADNLAAYAEEQKTALADILNGVVINILKQEWWR